MKAKPFKAVLFFIMFFLMINIGLSERLFAAKSKNVILVLDTSLSMIGTGGAGYKSGNIFERVKESIQKYIDQLDDGDKVTFMTFDEKVKTFPTVMVDDANDKDIIKKYISMTQATGKWTNTFLMMEKVLLKANDLEKEKGGDKRQTVIVIMTDALDDPPPASKSRLDIKKVLNPYGKKDWWVYLVSFNEIKNDPRLSAVKKQFEKDLALLTKEGKVIDASGSPEKIIGKQIPEDVKMLESQRSFLSPWLIVVIAVLALLLVLFLIKRSSQLVLKGVIEYWNNEVLSPYIEHFDITKRHLKNLTIGKGAGCQLNIRDFQLKSRFGLKAVREKGAIRASLLADQGVNIEFVNREAGAILQDGDIFKVGNFTFKYLDK